MDERAIGIPGWKIIRTIGRGSFGTVYEIEKDDEFGGGIRSALKVISIPESSDEMAGLQNEGFDEESLTELFRSRVEDITAEFRLMSKLKGCSNIVSYEDHTIIQHDQDPGYDVLIRMELLTSLPVYYRQNCERTEMTDGVVRKLGVDICNALELCREFQIIHRDIKPQNIFVNRHGDYKLGDFGIAKTSDHTTRATKTGTYGYMAPEVYLSKPYNASVDIYSLGLVMYWMLNERRGPFLPLPPAVPKSDQSAEALERRMSGEPLPAPKYGSEELKRIVLKACAFDPKDRYGNPTEMKRDLQRMMAEQNDEATIVPISFVPEKGAEEADRTVCNPDEVHSEEETPEGLDKKRSPVLSHAKEADETVSASAKQPINTERMFEKQQSRSKQPFAEKPQPAQNEASHSENKRNNEGGRANRSMAIALAALAAAVVIGMLILFLTLGRKKPSCSRDVVPEETDASQTGISETQQTPSKPAITPGADAELSAQTGAAPLYSSIDGGWMHTVGIRSDGTIAYTVDNDNPYEYSDWADIVKVSCGASHDLGLRRDGTVAACGGQGFGSNDDNVFGWQRIRDIAAGNGFSVGVKDDGTVYFVGMERASEMRDRILAWNDIVAVAAGNGHAVGLKKDGTVVAYGDNTYGQCNVADWSDIVAIAAGNETTVGLRSDGTVVATGLNDANQCDVADWSDIVAVAAGWGHTIGLRRDGTVVATGYNEDGRCNVQDWDSVVEIACGAWHSIGLKSDGTVVAVGMNNNGQCDVSKWSDMRVTGGPGNETKIESGVFERFAVFSGDDFKKREQDVLREAATWTRETAPQTLAEFPFSSDEVLELFTKLRSATATLETESINQAENNTSFIFRTDICDIIPDYYTADISFTYAYFNYNENDWSWVSIGSDKIDVSTYRLTIPDDQKIKGNEIVIYFTYDDIQIMVAYNIRLNKVSAVSDMYFRPDNIWWHISGPLFSDLDISLFNNNKGYNLTYDIASGKLKQYTIDDYSSN